MSNIDGHIELRDGDADRAAGLARRGQHPVPDPRARSTSRCRRRDVSIAKAAAISDARGPRQRRDHRRQVQAQLRADRPDPLDRLRDARAGKPFWEEYPTIGNADLRLPLDVRRFSVKNNIATIDLVGPLIEITNTPRDPRMSGSIRVQRGEFRIPGTRARFTRTSGSIDFAENSKAGEPAAQRHQRRARLPRPVGPGAPDHARDHRPAVEPAVGPQDLDRLQQVADAVAARARAQPGVAAPLARRPVARRRSDDASIRRRTRARASPIRSSRTSPATGCRACSATRSTKITGLDVLRIEIGFGSIGLRLEKKMLENVRLIGDAEQTIRGGDAQRARRAEDAVQGHVPGRLPRQELQRPGRAGHPGPERKPCSGCSCR